MSSSHVEAAKWVGQGHVRGVDVVVGQGHIVDLVAEPGFDVK